MVRRDSPRERRDERGFTLIELMIVVIIIAILAAVIVPMFTGEAKKMTAKSEVTGMLAELSAKEERYKVENSVYLASAECPAAPSASKQSISTCKVQASWTSLGIIPTEDQLRCTYTVVIGDAGDDPTTAYQPDGVTGLTIPTTAPALSWYVVQAQCNMDGDTGAYSYYVTGNLDSGTQVLNEGK